MMKDIHAVTGAYGYSGKYIAATLLAQKRKVITLTNSPRRDNSFGEQCPPHPFNFAEPAALTKSLQGVSVLYNTYWIRFNHKSFSHDEAVRNTRTLFRCAADAGVQRIVHTSITNPHPDSPLEYFRCKALLEKDLERLGVPYTILRPALLFGKEDILVNNIAWALRRFPVFGLFGDGAYRIQPIHVDDFAQLAVEAGGRRENEIIDAVGPETFSYRELVSTIAEHIGKRRPIIGLPPAIGYAVCALTGKLVGDVIVTREEVKGLMDDLLHVDSTPTGSTGLADWIREHADTLGYRYTSELARRVDRVGGYQSN